MFEVLKHGLRSPGGTATAIANCESHLGITLPADLRAFYQISDGFNDDVGNGYLVIWSLEELSRADGYEIFIFDTQRFLFGSNGGPTAYAFIDGAYVSVPFVAAGKWQDELILLSTSFNGFISEIAAGRGF